MLTKQTKFIIAVAIQLVIIFSIIIFKMDTLAGGAEVLLLIHPVDPTDPLRGDYITFSYDISDIDSYFFGYSPIREGDTVYVPLRQQGKYWGIRPGIQKTKPISEEKIFIKGKVSRSYGDRIHIIYGIEEYFIPEGTGQDFTFWGKEVAAKISIDKDGSAVLKKIYVNDKPWP